MSFSCDLLIHGGSVVTPEAVVRADLAITDGKFSRIASAVEATARETIDASGRYLFPGILDSHVHFNEPGRTDWEGVASGSAALAAGGGTMFFDMPLNSLPPTIDGAALAQKRAVAEQSALVDFALWGGLVPGNLERMDELAAGGVIGFKAFMCNSGVSEFPAANAATLRAGMARAAELGLLVAVHAEDDALAQLRTAEQHAKGTGVRAWLASRPVELELTAIRTALELAGETGCRLHLVHVSSPAGVELALAGRRAGLDVTVETCPHYLLLTEEDVVRLGAPAKCCPILRSEENRLGLWQKLEDGSLDTIGSDHSPAPPHMKQAEDFFAIWGGISGCQHGFRLLLSEALARRPADEALPPLAALLAANVARRFRLDAHKGRIAEGLDADLTLLRLGRPVALRNTDLLYRHQQGPYDGRLCGVAVEGTLLRGRPVFSEGRIAPGPRRGQFVRP